MIQAKLTIENGNVFVEENGLKEHAEKWIFKRVARLDLLAQRIIDYISKEKYFIPPRALLLDELEYSPDENERPCADALECASNILSRAPAGTSRLLYLISDAGEGKTTLINELSLQQAKSYQKIESQRLILPVSLGGRPFIRLDDVIVATLVNKLRFRYLYYNSVVELIKMGVLILALDGFEEMFVEKTSGDAISALGNLFQLLDSSGTILIASRKAYFEYRSLETQSKLFDTLNNVSVTSARIKLERWSKTEFITYCKKRKVNDPENLYNQIKHYSSEDNPILTRAVLAKNLIDLLQNENSQDELLQMIQDAPNSSFDSFVKVIIKREAEEKWIDSSGELAKPLMSVEEHFNLLGQIATEMWTSSSDTIKSDVLVLVTEMYCESLTKSDPMQFIKQVKERIRDHAMLISVDKGKYFSFDHEEFRNYFLGFNLYNVIVQSFASEFRRLLKMDRLPILSIDSLVYRLIQNDVNRIDVINWLQETSSFDNTASYLVENTGRIIMSILNGLLNEDVIEVLNMTFPVDSMYHINIQNVAFSNSHFHPSSLSGFQAQNISFTNCSFDRLEISSADELRETSFRGCIFHSIIEIRVERTYYDPTIIKDILKKHGAVFVDDIESLNAEVIIEDDEIQLIQKALRIFIRATEVNENIFRTKFGYKYRDFDENVLPILIEKGIITEVPFRGAGVQKRYKLTAQMDYLNQVLMKCRGSFQEFIIQVSN